MTDTIARLNSALTGRYHLDRELGAGGMATVYHATDLKRRRPDLVVLNSNPLLDIRKTTDIRYVMKAGRLYEARAMDEIWPRKKPYGKKPWDQAEIHRLDVRPDTFWDRPDGR